MSTTEPIRMLGRYELLRRIAKGGMGEIYLARTRGMAGFEKNCIIKTILPHLAEEEEFVTKFLDEGRIVVQLVHGNIVPVFDMGDEAGEVYMAMEYIPGRDLREVTKRLAARSKVMPVDLALFIAGEVCKGLDYAHRKKDGDGESLGIVHRDVSPSNVLISREGEIKLIDFGIARAAGRLSKTVSGRIQGKFCYMSPEQASGRPLDGRSDIFSAGLVLYELLTGFRPFEGGTDLESLDLVRQCEFDPPGALNAEIPQEVDDIVTKALAKDPDERYQSADTFQIALLQYLYSTGSSPTPNDLSAFLSELFPEGLEREELKSARGSGSPVPQKVMSLDEALDFELGRLDSSPSATGEVDPHETTAISADIPIQTPSTKTRVPNTPPQATEESNSMSVDVPMPSEEKKRRGVLVVVALLLVALLGGAFVMTTSSKGKRIIATEPPGAQISVNGLLIPGAVTPHELKLEEGEHKVTLELEGHERIEVNLQIEPGEEQGPAIVRLRKKATAEGPQTFQLHATPEHVELIVDGAVLASPTITLKPGEVITIMARASGCKSVSKQIEYGAANTGINFDLDCATTADAGSDEVVEKTITIKSNLDGATITVNGVSLGTAPAKWTGSSNTVLDVIAKKDDVTIRRSIRADRINDTLRMVHREKTSPAGCVQATIVDPYTADWHLDGKKVASGAALTRRKISSGKHKLRVVNEHTGLNHERVIDVKPGDKCLILSLDGKKLK